MLALPLPVPLMSPSSPAGAGAGSRLVWEYVYNQPARNAADPNCAMDLLLQVGPQATGALCSQNALLDLAVHILAEPYFDTLRTKQVKNRLCAVSWLLQRVNMSMLYPLVVTTT